MTGESTGEHPDGARDHAFTDAHARATHHPEGYPHHKDPAFEHQAGGGPCAACGPCTDTLAEPLFLCDTCLTLLDNELRHFLTRPGLSDRGPQPKSLTSRSQPMH